MRKFFVVLFCAVLMAGMLSAQERTGNIYGTVVDRDGNPLPGVTVTLTGPHSGAVKVQSSAEGRFRFPSLFPSNEYVITAELQGFKTAIQKGVIVNVNSTSEIKVTMEQGALEEQVTVVAKTPIISAKKTQITHTVNYDQLQSLPTARDPWIILQMIPAVQMDRENVGGVESGQQASFMNKGSTAGEWTVDGMQTTDRNSGGSPGYYDFDAFEEMNISTGQMDVEHRDPGIVINLVTRRGGNKMSLGGRFYYTNEQFQMKISPATLADKGVGGYNRAVDLKDFGFNAGGPIWKDKIWWWGAYGVQQIQTLNLVNIRDDTYLVNYNGKLNFQLIPENRAEILYSAGDKKKFGRSSSNSFPPGWNQHSNYYFGNPTYKFQDEQMIGDNLFISARYGYSNAGFGLWPANDEKIAKVAWYDVENDLYYNSQTWFYSDRPHPYGVLQVQYFNDNLFGTGTSHEIKIGAEINNNNRTYTGGYPGNFHVNTNFNSETVDWNGDGKMDVVRDAFGIDIKRIYIGSNDVLWHDGTDRLAFYFNDTITAGRFNLNLGLRVDRAKAWLDPETTRSLWLQPGGNQYQQYYSSINTLLFTADTVAKLAPLIPEKPIPAIEAKKVFWTFSPRLGLTYDVFGDGKTIAKLAYSLYPGSGNGLGLGYWMPQGMYGSMNFWWADLNNDGKASYDELYWANYSDPNRSVYKAFDASGNFQGNWARENGLMWSGWDINNPLGLSPSTSYLADDWKVNLTHQVLVSIEREIIQDFGVSVDWNWQRQGRFSNSPPYYPETYNNLPAFPGLNNHVRTKDDYMQAGTIPSQLTKPDGTTFDPGQAAGKPWYLLKNLPETVYTPYTKTVMMDPDRRDIYWGIDVVLTKRLSHKWMMNGSFTYQSERHYYGANGYAYTGSTMDPTNLWAYEGQLYGVGMGGSSGKITRQFFTRWMVKLSGLYQLPWDLNVSGTLSGHEGTYYATTFGIRDSTVVGASSRESSKTIPTVAYDNTARLPNTWMINVKVEKMLKLGETSRMYFSADIFNVINANTALRKYDIGLGTFRYTGTTPVSYTSPATTSGVLNELLNPLLLRLGMRFQI
jgi:hypothetical protein